MPVNKSDTKLPHLTRGGAFVVRAVKGDKDAGYTDFNVRLCSDFRRPLFRNYEGGIVYETLVHDDDAIELDFVERGFSFLQAKSHYSDDRPGRILEKSSEINAEDGLTYLDATVRIIDDGGAGSIQIKRWRGLVDRNLSIDYMWVEWRVEESAETHDVDYIITKWRLIGVSVVGQPADEEVGLMSERDLALVREIIMPTRNPSTDPAPDPVPVPKARTTDPAPDPVPKARTTDPAPDPVPKARTTDPAPDPVPAPTAREDNRPSYDEMRAQITEDYDSAIKTLGDRQISGSARTKLEDIKAEAVGRFHYSQEYTRGSVQQKIFEFLITTREGGLHANEEFKIDGVGNVQRDETKNPMVRAIADSMKQINASRGTSFDFSKGAYERLNNKDSRDAGAHQEYEQAVFASMDLNVRQTMESHPGVMISPDMYLRMLIANPKSPRKETRDRLKDIQKRVFSSTLDSSGKGGNLVATDVLIEEFVPSLYASAHTDMLGNRTIMGISSNIQIPTQTSKIADAWLTENGAYTLSDATIGAVVTAPHRIASGADVTFLLPIQTGGASDDIVLGMLMAAMEEGIDIVILTGAASGNDPTGVLNITGINTGDVNFATAGAAGRYAAILALENALLADDVPVEMLKWSIAAEAVDNLRASPRDTVGGTGNFIMVGNMLADIPAYPTSILSGDTASDKFSICSDWSHSIIVTYGMPILTMDPYSKAASGEKRVIINCYMDHIVTQPVRFVAGNATAF